MAFKAVKTVGATFFHDLFAVGEFRHALPVIQHLIGGLGEQQVTPGLADLGNIQLP